MYRTVELNMPPLLARARSGHAPARRQLLKWGCAFAASAPVFSRAASTPSISVKLLDGREFSTDQARGKVLFVNFWATWCGPCRAEMPEIEAYFQQHRDQGLEVLALSVDE